jgi:hypothetical protein
MQRKIELCLLILLFVFFLNPNEAIGQEACTVPTVTETLTGIADWRPMPIIYSDSDEIAPGGSVNLWVEGGCQQSYSWSVTGAGYTLSQTPPWNDQRRMTLTCDPGT